jgi:hypothetical protein
MKIIMISPQCSFIIVILESNGHGQQTQEIMSRFCSNESDGQSSEGAIPVALDVNHGLWLIDGHSVLRQLRVNARNIMLQVKNIII